MSEVEELKKEIEALKELNTLLLKNTTEQKKLLESLGIEKESSMEKWIV